VGVLSWKKARPRLWDRGRAFRVRQYNVRKGGLPMNVAPFHPDPRLLDVLWPLYVAAGALAIGLVLRNVVDRFLDEGDPRRQLIAQAVLYAGAFIVIAVSIWLRHRG
jgi:hypothetical protein